jgi:osmoprotectant transport system ATP-binding protein
MIRFDDVSVTFGEVVALHHLDLVFEAGRTSVVIGPSGCGKSTLLRLLVGLAEPSQGRVWIGEQEVTPETVQALRRKMGYVIQSGGLFPHLTARGNLTLLAEHLGRPTTEPEERLAALCQLTHFPPDGLDRYPAELSGGQQQRVGLMRALMQDPDVLLLDEPLGALDPLVRRELQDELKSVFRTLEKTVVLVTHDMTEAAYLADRIVLMKGGSVVQAGTLDDLRQRPAAPFVSDFLAAQRRPVEI